MDTSETYIKMCEKAEEIQLDWNPASGDLYYEHIDRKPLALWTDYDRAELLVHRIIGSDDEQNLASLRISSHVKADAIWLPRQDQLQEMVISRYRYEIVASLLMDFERWRDTYGHNELTSMEQLWLAFVMKEKYGKIWDGAKWVRGQSNK